MIYEELQPRNVGTLGSGSFGNVLLVRSEAKRQHYALKMFNIHEVVQQNRAEYVKREKEILRMLSSPFIVKLLCADMDKVHLMLLMEFVRGGELVHYLHGLSKSAVGDCKRLSVYQQINTKMYTQGMTLDCTILISEARKSVDPVEPISAQLPYSPEVPKVERLQCYVNPYHRYCLDTCDPHGSQGSVDYPLIEVIHGREASQWDDLRDAVRFYAVEIVLALEHIHSKSIVYRDLKPENLLLSSNGHVKLADFGLAKILRGRTYTICGTAEYMAPEMLSRKGYDLAVDWWSLGVLIYELLCGEVPFTGESEEIIFDSIRKGDVNFPQDFESSARTLILALLNRSPRMRGENIHTNEWFSGIDWNNASELSFQPPIIPASFDVQDLLQPATNEEHTPSAQRERDLFADWIDKPLDD